MNQLRLKFRNPLSSNDMVRAGSILLSKKLFPAQQIDMVNDTNKSIVCESSPGAIGEDPTKPLGSCLEALGGALDDLIAIGYRPVVSTYSIDLPPAYTWDALRAEQLNERFKWTMHIYSTVAEPLFQGLRPERRDHRLEQAHNRWMRITRLADKFTMHDGNAQMNEHYRAALYPQGQDFETCDVGVSWAPYSGEIQVHQEKPITELNKANALAALNAFAGLPLSRISLTSGHQVL